MVVEIIGVAVAIGVIGVLTVGKTISSWYRVVPTSEAHLVTNRQGMKVFSSDKKGIAQAALGNAYYAVPENIPYFGSKVRRMDLTIKEVPGDQIAYEKNQGRFKIDWSLKYRIVDVMKAAETSNSDQELRQMLVAPIEAAVNSVTTEYDVTVLRSSKQEIQEKIKHLLDSDLSAWGLDLISFQLGEFRDTSDSTIISDISKRSEEKIHSETRILVADRQKEARLKEAEAAEIAGKREIEKESRLATEKELMKQQIAAQNKVTQEKDAEVLRVQTTQAAKIAQEKALIEADMRNQVAEKKKIEAEQNAEAEKIERVKAAEAEKAEIELQAQADATQVELAALAEAAKINAMTDAEARNIREKGLAEAEAKEKMAEAMKQFDLDAINAMTASEQIQAGKEIGIANAKALETADIKVFVGGDNSSGFDMGKVMESFAVSSPNASGALLNRIAKPNDLGIGKVIDINTTEVSN